MRGKTTRIIEGFSVPSSITPYMRSKAENVRGWWLCSSCVCQSHARGKASGRRYLVIVRIGDKVLSSRQPQGGAYIRARLHFISAYPVIDRSHALAVASSRRFNIFHKLGRRIGKFLPLPMIFPKTAPKMAPT